MEEKVTQKLIRKMQNGIDCADVFVVDKKFQQEQPLVSAVANAFTSAVQGLRLYIGVICSSFRVINKEGLLKQIQSELKEKNGDFSLQAGDMTTNKVDACESEAFISDLCMELSTILEAVNKDAYGDLIKVLKDYQDYKPERAPKKVSEECGNLNNELPLCYVLFYCPGEAYSIFSDVKNKFFSAVSFVLLCDDCEACKYKEIAAKVSPNSIVVLGDGGLRSADELEVIKIEDALIFQKFAIDKEMYGKICSDSEVRKNVVHDLERFSFFLARENEKIEESDMGFGKKISMGTNV